MSEEIFVNTGTSFQQPYIARQPAIGTAPAIGTVEARTPTNVQIPFTYSNRTPFTYQANRNAQSPYIAAAQQPYPYIANSQTPYIASARQPYPYIAQARQPNIYQHVTNQQTPYIANAQQPYPYIANQQTPYIANGQTPFTYQNRQPGTYSAQGRTPYIATTSQTITETNINNSVTGEVYITKNSSSDFITTIVDHYVKFVFSNGTTNTSGATARKISLYMNVTLGSIPPSGGYSGNSTPSGLVTTSSYVLMGEYETPSGFAPDAYSVELTSVSVSGSGAGQVTRIYDIAAGQPNIITKAFLDANQSMSWGYTSSGFGYRTTMSTECFGSTKVFTDNFALTFRKSGYPNIVVDTFKFITEHINNHTAGGNSC